LNKEPNGTLVMTTCKCREHGTNLVMTRTWFDATLQSKIEQGVKMERERVVEILETQLSCSCETPLSHAISLIEGKHND
jgi:hypothetical protein